MNRASRESSRQVCHIITDHQHYWEEGGSNSSLNSGLMRLCAQEGDPHFSTPEPPPIPEHALGRNAEDAPWMDIDRTNRKLMEESWKLTIETFENGLDFMERYAKSDNWFLQIETFDPHEPFFTLPEHKELYAQFYEQSRELVWDWPH